jgi:hypothetical protein
VPCHTLTYQCMTLLRVRCTTVVHLLLVFVTFEPTLHTEHLTVPSLYGFDFKVLLTHKPLDFRVTNLVVIESFTGSVAPSRYFRPKDIAKEQELLPCSNQVLLRVHGPGPKSSQASSYRPD